jgi:thimet oligopeptidase
VEALERKELDELRVEKVVATGDKEAVLKRWDVPFYQQRLKKLRYSVDQNAVRAQFPTDQTIAWMMQVTSTLYGVQFKLNRSLPVWQPDVRGYDVFDTTSGKYLSSFYLDLFPREGKYKHAAAFPVRGVSMVAGRTPVSVLVTNFSREGFDQSELETLFHEFGHIMHGVLSKTRYVLNAGTGVKRDFVEAPSQMYEEWSRRPEALALFAQVCPTCKPIDPKLIERMNASRAFGKGILYARQRLYAAWDMALHTPVVVDPMQTWVELESKTPLGHETGTMTPANFGHVMGGYQAGYYGYMWSEVLALDMRSAFGANVMDTRLGTRYRRLILERGGEQAPSALVEAFLQRKPSSEAFFREISGQ